MNIEVNSFLFNITAQFAHFFTAAFLMHEIKAHAPRFAKPVLFAGLLAAAIKEFIYDYVYETPAERGSSLLDFAMYALGLVLGYFGD